MGYGTKRKNQFGTERRGKIKILGFTPFLTTELTEDHGEHGEKISVILYVFLVPSVVIFYLYGCHSMLILISIFIK